MTKEMCAITRLFWGAHAPSRADFGGLAEILLSQQKEVVGELPTTACEVHALPRERPTRPGAAFRLNRFESELQIVD